MNPSTIHTSALNGVDAPSVTVEVGITNGLPGITIVGLAKKEVRESASRVRHALRSSKFEMPPSSITVNLAPVELPKSGGRYDIPIALGILAASKQIDPTVLAGAEFLGELALTGALRPVPGVLPSLLAASRRGRTLFLPEANSAEAGLVKAARAVAVTDLRQLVDRLYAHGEPELVAYSGDRVRAAAYPEVNDVIEMAQAKRAMEIAAAGAHNLLLSGPPGAGKSMLAKRFPGLLPPMSEEEALETAALHSLKGIALEENWRRRPFRNPHHTCSVAALVGGGARPTPGEISLAHNGGAVPGRAAAIPPRCLGIPSGTAGNPQYRGVQGPLHGYISGALPVAGCDEPLSLRLRRRSAARVPLHSGGGAPLPGTNIRTVPRPHRLACAGLPAGASHPGRRSPRWTLKRPGPDAGRGSPGNTEGPKHEMQCRTEGRRTPGPLPSRGRTDEPCLGTPRKNLRFRRAHAHESSRWPATIADLESAGRVAERHIAEALALRGSGFS